jgi:hypothetical protein
MLPIRSANKKFCSQFQWKKQTKFPLGKSTHKFPRWKKWGKTSMHQAKITADPHPGQKL